MIGPRCLGAALLASLPAQGCMFLVDFDELKQGSGADAGSDVPEPGPGGGGNGPGGPGPSGGGGNGPGPSGGAGSGPGPDCTVDPDCDDGDPCTTDTCSDGECENAAVVCQASDPCLEAACVDGQCVETPQTGVVADGFEDVVRAEQIHRVRLVPGSDRFFHAVYGVFDDGADLRLGGFSASDDAKLRVQSLASGLRGSTFQIASPAGLVVTDEQELNVYVGVRDTSLASTPDLGEVLRIVFDQDLALTANMARRQGSAPSYLFVSDRVGPEASRVPGNEPFVVWPGRTAEAEPRTGLFYQQGDEVVQIDQPRTGFTAVPDPLTGLQALYTQSTPAAVWTTSSAAGGVQLFAGTAAGEWSELAQCAHDPAEVGLGLHASLTLDDLWTVSWSKEATGGFFSENTVVECAGTTCTDRSDIAVGEACDDATVQRRVTEDVRHLLVEAFPDPTDANVLYQVILLGVDQGGDSTLAAIANRVDLSVTEGGEERLGTVTIASGDTDGGPDWPTVAVLPPDKLAIGWITPAAEGDGQEAHLARYRICR